MAPSTRADPAVFPGIMVPMPETAWPEDADGLIALQQSLREWAADALRRDPFRLPAVDALCKDPFWLPPAPLIGGCFVAFARGEAGPGRPGDRAFAAAVVWEPGHEAVLRRGRGGVPARSEGRALRGTTRSAPRQAADVVDQAVVREAVGAAYVPGLLALREGPVLAAAVSALRRRPDVLLVDASGLDHPRRAGLAVHLGWALDLPTVGITRRPLHATAQSPPPGAPPPGAPPPGRAAPPPGRAAPPPGRAAPPAPAGEVLSPLVPRDDHALRRRGEWTPLVLDGDVVAAAVCTRTGARPVIAHAAWRTSVDTAVAVALAASTEGARAPVPLQEARRVAREARDLFAAP